MKPSVPYTYCTMLVLIRSLCVWRHLPTLSTRRRETGGVMWRGYFSKEAEKAVLDIDSACPFRALRIVRLTAVFGLVYHRAHDFDDPMIGITQHQAESVLYECAGSSDHFSPRHETRDVWDCPSSMPPAPRPLSFVHAYDSMVWSVQPRTTPVRGYSLFVSVSSVRGFLCSATVLPGSTATPPSLTTAFSPSAISAAVSGEQCAIACPSEGGRDTLPPPECTF